MSLIGARLLSRAGREREAAKRMVKEALLCLGFLTTLVKNYYSSLRLSDLVDDLETTDRPTGRAIVAVRRIDVAIVAEVQAARVVSARRSRPIEAEAADMVETANIAVAITRSRIPDGRG